MRQRQGTIIGRFNRTGNFVIISAQRVTTALKCVASFTNNGKSEAPEHKMTKKTIIIIIIIIIILFFIQCPHMSFTDCVVFPPGHGRSVTDF